MSTIKQGTLDRAASIKKSLKADANGVIALDKDFYYSHLGEGVTKEMVDAVHSDRAQFLAASGLALGEVGLAAFAKDKKLATVTMSGSVGQDKFEQAIERVKTSRIPGPGDKTSTSYGVLSTTYVAHGSRNVAELGRVREHLKALGEEALA